MLVGPDLSDGASEERGLGAGNLRDLLSRNQMAKVSCALGQRHRLSHREISAHGLYHFIFAATSHTVSLSSANSWSR